MLLYPQYYLKLYTHIQYYTKKQTFIYSLNPNIKFIQKHLKKTTPNPLKVHISTPQYIGDLLLIPT